MTKQNFKRGDTRPAIEYKPTENNHRVSLPDGVSATFELVDSDDNVAVVVDAQATVESTDPATLSYTFSAGETDVAGDYEAEFEVQYSDGGTRTFPDVETIPVSIHPDLDADGTVSVDDTRHDVTVGTVDAEVVNAQELLVSDSTAVTGGPVGNEGEFTPLDSGTIQSRATTTNTTYSGVIPNGDRTIFDLDGYDLTNISQLYVSAAVNLNQDTDAETVSFVLMFENSRIPETEVTAPYGFTDVATSRVVAPSQSGIVTMKADLKVSGGTGWLYNRPQVTLWGEIQ